MTKKQRKEQQQKKWGLTVDGRIPMVLVSDVDQNIRKILEEIVDGIASLGIQLVIIDSDATEIRESCDKWHGNHPESIKCVSENEVEEDLIDIMILKNVGDKDLAILKENNMVPIAEGGKVSSFDPIAEKGNGFIFESNPWSLFASLVRAAETYRFPYDWKNIIKAVHRTK